MMRELLLRISVIVITTTLLMPPALIAQKVRADLVSEDIVRDRLSKGLVGGNQRQAAIKDLFADAGCTAEEQPIDKRSGNVICTLPGQTDSTIVVGGHFDFVDRGEGIVDDWSGVSLLPSLYQALGKVSRRNTYVFVAFAEEERGLIGSSWYIKHLTAYQRTKIRAYVNLECLGLTTVKVWVHRSSPALVKQFSIVANSLAIPLQEVDVERIGDDDTHPFLWAKVPVISLHSLTQENFRILHSLNDTAKAIRLFDYYLAYKLVAVYLASLDLQPA